MPEHPLPPGGGERAEVRWRVGKAAVLRALNDHERAEPLELEALKQGERKCWLVAVRARGLAQEDRRDDRLGAR